MSRIATAVFSVAVGALLALALIWCWAWIASVNPLPALFANGGLRGLGFQGAVATADFLINMVLCLPAAWALWRFGAYHLWLNTTLALVACVVTGAIAVGFPLFSYGPVIWVTYLLLLASLPVDVWVLSKFRRNTPGSSSKSNPLREPA